MRYRFANEKLREARKKLGLTLEQMTAGYRKHTGKKCFKQQIHAWETGYSVPNANSLTNILAIYKLIPENIFLPVEN